MSGTTFSVSVEDAATRYGVSNLTLQLWEYPVSIDSDGVVSGTRAVDADRADIDAEEGGNGIYTFSGVLSGSYSIVVVATNLKTQVLNGYERLEILSIDKINEIIQFLRDNSRVFEAGTLPDLI